ncbi:MAG: 4Fe-4S dicluster domain-containing protein [Ignavibacteriales bacterium]
MPVRFPRGCGVCQRVCPSRKIAPVNKKPVWHTHVRCYMCYACLNYCPQHSVQIKSKVWMKSYTEKNARYFHPYATAG